MSLLSYIILCVLVGVVVYLCQRAPFIPAEIKQIILWAAIVVLVLVLVMALFGGIGDVQIPRLLR